MPCSNPHAPPVLHLQHPFLLFICKWMILYFAVLSDISVTPDHKITSCLLWYYPILLQNSQILPVTIFLILIFEHKTHSTEYEMVLISRITNSQKTLLYIPCSWFYSTHCCPPLWRDFSPTKRFAQTDTEYIYCLTLLQESTTLSLEIHCCGRTYLIQTKENF